MIISLYTPFSLRDHTVVLAAATIPLTAELRFTGGWGEEEKMGRKQQDGGKGRQRHWQERDQVLGLGWEQ